MSKVMLVMDKQEKCNGCILHGTIIGKQICLAEFKRVSDENEKPDWCPLKEVPKKIEKATGDMDYYKAVGFNACIDEILKESD